MEVPGHGQQIRSGNDIYISVELNKAFARRCIHTGRRRTTVGELRKRVRSVPTDRPAGEESLNG